jgi:hypothetical protein
LRTTSAGKRARSRWWTSPAACRDCAPGSAATAARRALDRQPGEA